MAWKIIKLTVAEFAIWNPNAVVLFKGVYPDSTITSYAEPNEHKHNDTHVYAVFDDSIAGLDRPVGESYDPSIIFNTLALAEADGMYSPEDKNGISQYSILPTSRGFKQALDEETTVTKYSVIPTVAGFRYVLDNVYMDYYNI